MKVVRFARRQTDRVAFCAAVTFLAISLTLTTPAAAQMIQQAGFLQPSPPSEQVTLELINACRKEVADSVLGDDAKKKIDEHYKVATDGLKRVFEFAASAAQFKQDTDDVQQRLQLLKQRMAELQQLKPGLPSYPTLPELEQDRTNRDVQFDELKSALAKIEAEPTTRANRRKEIRAQLLSAAQRAADIDKQLTIPTPTDESPLLTKGRLTELGIRRLLIDAEQPAIQSELSKYDSEDATDYVRQERDVRTQEVALVEAELKLFDEEIAKRRADENAAALRRASDAAITAEPLLQDDAKANELLAERAVKLTTRSMESTCWNESALLSRRLSLPCFLGECCGRIRAFCVSTCLLTLKDGSFEQNGSGTGAACWLR